MKILVVDDIEENVYQLQVLLGASGYTVVTAANGAAALVQARQDPPDLIVTDILMPVMDGFSLCREWMQDERLKSIPLIFYTATYTDERDRSFALGLGAADFIVKPEEPENLLRMIQKVLAEQAHVPGSVGRPESSPHDTIYLKEYNEALIRKLEDKMREVEQTNRELQCDIARRQQVEEELQFRNVLLSTQQEASIDGILVVDDKARILSHNRRFVELWGLPEPLLAEGYDEPALQFVMNQVEDPQAFLQRVRQLYDHRQETSRDELRLTDGRVFDRYSAPMFGPNKRYYGRVWYFRDITQRKQAEEALRVMLVEKEALLKEVHHRVKNNLQLITSLLRLVEGEHQDSATKTVLRDMQGRIRSMALLHETLYRAGDFTRVNLADYVQQVAKQLLRAYLGSPCTAQLALDLNKVEVEIDQAIPCGLIVNELLTNTLKHAFSPGQTGEVRVTLNLGSEGRVYLGVSDNGVGLPSGFSLAGTQSLGLRLVADLSQQLEGELLIGPSPGASFTIVFRLKTRTAAIDAATADRN